jgi:hypothetical protein
MAFATVAASAQTYRSDAPREIRVIVNGDQIEFNSIGPREINGRLLVPLRGVLEKLGAYVDWDAGTQTVLANREGTKIEIPIGSRYATVNGERMHLDVAAITISGNTMVPLRFLSETLGARVNWDYQTNTARISSGDGSATTGRNEDSNPNTSAYRRQRREDSAQSVRDSKMPVIESVDTDFAGGRLPGGDTINVTMRATPGGRGFFRIRGVVGERKMTETSAGLYEGSWRSTTGRDYRVNRADILAFVGLGSRSTAEKTPDVLR